MWCTNHVMCLAETESHLVVPSRRLLLPDIRKVLCENLEREDTQTLRSRMRRWYEKECFVLFRIPGISSHHRWHIYHYYCHPFPPFACHISFYILCPHGHPCHHWILFWRAAQHPRVIIALEPQFYRRIGNPPTGPSQIKTMPMLWHLVASLPYPMLSVPTLAFLDTSFS